VTLYILDIKDIKNKIRNFIIITLICLAFGLIYELFSHQVYSVYMLGAFIIPLIMGIIVPSILCRIKMPSSIVNNLYNASITTFIFGSFIKGFLDIYGTTNSKIIVYPVAGFVLLIMSICIYLFVPNKYVK